MAAKTLEDIPGVGPAIADKLREGGYTEIMNIAVAAPKDLADVCEIGEKKAMDIIEGAKLVADIGGFETGDSILTDQGSEGIRVRMTQLDYSTNADHNPDFYCMSSGAYQNTKVFEGVYNVRVDGPFIPLVRENADGTPLADETQTVKVKGSTEVIFKVHPFLRVEFVGYPTVSNGQITAKVKVTRAISREDFKAYIEPMGNYDDSFANITDVQLFISYSSSVGYRARDERWSSSLEYSGNAFDDYVGKPVTIKSTKGVVIPSGRHVFVRAAARINYDTPLGSGTRR